MKGVNLVILVGNLGKDPEMQYAQSGVAVCKFSIATAERIKKGNEWIEETEWHNCVTFGKIAENCGKYLSKGSTVYLRGRINTSRWKDKDDNKREAKQIIISDVTFLSPSQKKDSGSQQKPAQSGQQRQAPQIYESNGGPREIDDSDIPW